MPKKKKKTGILLIDLCKRPDTFTRSLGLGYKVPFRNWLNLDLNTQKKMACHMTRKYWCTFFCNHMT